MSETITIVVNTANAAFEDAPASEVARILRTIADRMESHGIPPCPRDANGNKCGSVSVVKTE